jgi:hypothetical protein
MMWRPTPSDNSRTGLKPALEPAAHRTQLLRRRQRHVVHLSAGKGAGHTRRKADIREKGNALRVAQLRPNKLVEVRLDHSQQRQRLRMHGRLQRCRLNLLHLRFPLTLDGSPTCTFKVAQLQLCDALHVRMLQGIFLACFERGGELTQES